MKAYRTSVGFYSLALALNMLVALMFYIVTTPPPVHAIAPISIPLSRRVVPAVSGIPDRLIISRIGINLPVDTGTYDPSTGSWTLSDTSAYYADMSMPANDSNGTTLLYAHARAGLFLDLPSLRPGDEANVYTTNGRVFRYRYQAVRNVSPNDTSVFTSNGTPTLVLQTCDGAWDIYRALYSFQFVSQEAA